MFESPAVAASLSLSSDATVKIYNYMLLFFEARVSMSVGVKYFGHPLDVKHRIL
jgi:hypothetical protein